MTTYRIVRFYARVELDNEVLETGLTLDEAQEHCSDPETSSRTCTTEKGQALTESHGDWFDGYCEE